MSPSTSTTRIGVSGWSYDSWRGDWYPEDLPRDEELAYVSRQLDTVEINGTFYSLASPGDFLSWRESVPEDFVFAVKGSNYITHSKKLKDPETPLANFFASGILRLDGTLGPILWQLPSSAPGDAKRMERFLELLPDDFEAAAGLAEKHDPDVVDDAWFEVSTNRRIRHALEPRNPDAFTDELIRLLRDTGVALVVSESAGDWPLVEDVTADFVYLRLHGRSETYASRYSDATLEEWAERIESWRDGEEPEDARRISDEDPDGRDARDVYVYFDNDQRGHAPKDAERMAGMLG